MFAGVVVSVVAEAARPVTPPCGGLGSTISPNPASNRSGICAMSPALVCASVN